MGLTVAFIARDEAARLADSLASVAWAEERVVVVDDRTTDASAEVAAAHGARVFVRRFDDFAAQRRFAHEQATQTWLLWMDCDERVTAELADEIRAALAAPRFDGYQVPRLDYMFGRWLRHGGWYPQNHVRLVRRAAAAWRRPVHEVVEVAGPVGTLRSPMLHFSHARVSDWLAKMGRYTRLEAEAMVAEGRRVGVLALTVEPGLYAGYKLFVQQGWRDGAHGLALALLLGCYRLARNLQVWDLQQAARRPPESPECPPRISRS